MVNHDMCKSLLLHIIIILTNCFLELFYHSLGRIHRECTHKRQKMREVGVEERHRHVYVYDTLHTELQPPPSHAGRLGCTSGPHHYREGFKGRVGPQAHVSSSSSCNGYGQPPPLRGSNEGLGGWPACTCYSSNTHQKHLERNQQHYHIS